jgi:hypothetical protein
VKFHVVVRLPDVALTPRLTARVKPPPEDEANDEFTDGSGDGDSGEFGGFKIRTFEEPPADSAARNIKSISSLPDSNRYRHRASDPHPASTQLSMPRGRPRKNAPQIRSGLQQTSGGNVALKPEDRPYYDDDDGGIGGEGEFDDDDDDEDDDDGGGDSLADSDDDGTGARKFQRVNDHLYSAPRIGAARASWNGGGAEVPPRKKPRGRPREYDDDGFPLARRKEGRPRKFKVIDETRMLRQGN